jgi:hypothetical protein
MLRWASNTDRFFALLSLVEESVVRRARLHRPVPYTFAWRAAMLWTVFVILLVLWLLGMVSSYAGRFIHILLVIAGDRADPRDPGPAPV